MAENSNGAPKQGMLLQFFKDWQQADQRLQMAQRTLAGAQNDAVLKEARFKGGMELIYGPNSTYTYDEKTGLTFKTANQAARRRARHKTR